jgi:hypothetical protein
MSTGSAGMLRLAMHAEIRAEPANVSRHAIGHPRCWRVCQCTVSMSLNLGGRSARFRAGIAWASGCLAPAEDPRPALLKHPEMNKAVVGRPLQQSDKKRSLVHSSPLG